MPTNTAPTPTPNDIRYCMALCLYAIEFGPADRDAAKSTAGKLMGNGTTWTRPEQVPQIIDMALAEPPEFFERFQLSCSREDVVRYLQFLREELCALLEVKVSVSKPEG